MVSVSLQNVYWRNPREHTVSHSQPTTAKPPRPFRVMPVDWPKLSIHQPQVALAVTESERILLSKLWELGSPALLTLHIPCPTLSVRSSDLHKDNHRPSVRLLRTKKALESHLLIPILPNCRTGCLRDSERGCVSTRGAAMARPLRL